MPARGAGTSSAAEERASADTVTRGAPPKRAIRLGIVIWSAFRKGAGCRDGEGTPPRSADRIRASTARRRLVRMWRDRPFLCPTREERRADRAIRDHRFHAPRGRAVLQRALHDRREDRDREAAGCVRGRIHRADLARRLAAVLPGPPNHREPGPPCKGPYARAVPY